MKVEIFSVFGAAILSSGLADGATLLAYVHEGFPPVSASVVTHRASAKPAHHISPRIKKYVRFGISNMKYETNSTDRISSSQQIGKDYRTDIMSGFGNPDTNLDTSPERRLLTDFFAATYLNGDDIVRILSGDRGIVNLAGHDPHASLGVGSQVEPIEFLSSREINYLAGDYGRWNE